MPDQNTESTTPAAEESGAGYGNNAQTDDVSTPAEDDEQASEAHPS